MAIFNLKPEIVDEMSLVFKNFEGKEYAPRNPEARVLAVKGGEKPSFLNRMVQRLKAGWPVATDVPDKVDGDGDGADDYNQLCSLLCQTYGDLSQAIGINDDEARAAAICAVLDGFHEDYSAVYAGDEQKAGARHSAADKASLDAIAQAHDALAQMSDHVAAIAGALKDLGITAAHGPVEGEQGPEQDEGPDNSQVDDDAEKAKGKKPYGDVEYADPANGKYPIDTEEHARAAWSYINQEKNASEYSADELAKVKAKIKAACEKFGIEINDDKKADEVEMTKEEIQALVAEAASKAAEEATARVQAEADARVAEANRAAAEASAKAAQAQAAQAVADATLKAASLDAARPTAASTTTNAAPSGRLASVLKAQMAMNPESHAF